jgi:hypothetical protein
MFLTGFDATTLNTLWVDKNLRLHGLLQAFSRTNRILNSVKTYGNIVCFRDLEDNTNEAISIFGNKDAGGIVVRVIRGTEPEWYDAAISFNKGDRANMTWALSRAKIEALGIHASETAWVGTKFDVVLDNNSTIDELTAQVKDLVEDRLVATESLPYATLGHN